MTYNNISNTNTSTSTNTKKKRNIVSHFFSISQEYIKIIIIEK